MTIDENHVVTHIIHKTSNITMTLSRALGLIISCVALGYTNAFLLATPTCQHLRLDAHKEDALTSDATPMALTSSRRSILESGSLVSLMISLLSPSMATAAAAVDNTNKALGEEYRQGTAALADMDEAAPVPREAYQKLDSGVVVADLRPGNGETVKEGSRVNLQWVLRKSNGYFVDSSHVSDDVPFIFVVGDGSAIAGIDQGVRGMKVGGTRRILIPPRLAYVQGLEDGKPGPLPQGFGPRQQMRRVQEVRKDVPGEYVFLEVQVTRVR